MKTTAVPSSTLAAGDTIAVLTPAGSRRRVVESVTRNGDDVTITLKGGVTILDGTTSWYMLVRRAAARTHCSPPPYSGLATATGAMITPARLPPSTGPAVPLTPRPPSPSGSPGR